MLTLDTFLNPTITYDPHAAPVLRPPADLQPADVRRRQALLSREYTARHAVLNGYVAARVLGLNPKWDAQGVAANRHAAALDEVLWVLRPDAEQAYEQDVTQAKDDIRMRLSAAVGSADWLGFMMAEDVLARAQQLKPPPLDIQPRLSRDWARSMIARVQGKLAARP